MSNVIALGPSTAFVASAPTGGQGRIRIDADDRALMWFGLCKIVLTWLTLGIYHFWGRAEARRRIYGAIEIEGYRPVWTGTGARTFRNFLLAVAVASPGLWVLAGYLPSGLAGLEFRLPSDFILRRIYVGMPLMFLLGSAVYRRRSHQFRNTWIGSDNLRMTGGAWSYAWTHFWTSLVVPFTLGAAVPWRTEKLCGRITSEQAFAGHAFRYFPDWRGLVRSFAWVWGATLVTYVGMMLGLATVAGPELVLAAQTRSLVPLVASGAWPRALAIVVVAMVLFHLIAKVWMAITLRHQAARTQLGGARFSLELPIAGYAGMAGSNLLLRIVTLGVLTPWCEVRHWRYLLRHIEVHGPLPQPTSSLPATINPA